MKICVEGAGGEVVPEVIEVGEGHVTVNSSTGSIVQLTAPSVAADLVRVRSVVCSAPVWLWAGRVRLWPLNEMTTGQPFIVPHHTELYLIPQTPALVDVTFESIFLDSPLLPTWTQRWFGGRLGNNTAEDLFDDPGALARGMETFAPNYYISPWTAPLLLFLAPRKLLHEPLLHQMNPRPPHSPVHLGAEWDELFVGYGAVTQERASFDLFICR